MAKEPINALPLFINEDDLDPQVRAALHVKKNGGRLLDEDKQADSILAEALPKAAVKKLSRLLPKGYTIQSVQLEFELCGIVAKGKMGVVLVPN